MNVQRTEDSGDLLPTGWIPLGVANRWLSHRLMVKGSRFTLDHWDHKYINVRVDMRTGLVCMSPGNTLPDQYRETLKL